MSQNTEELPDVIEMPDAPKLELPAGSKSITGPQSDEAAPVQEQAEPETIQEIPEIPVPENPENTDTQAETTETVDQPPAQGEELYTYVPPQEAQPVAPVVPVQNQNQPAQQQQEVSPFVAAAYLYDLAMNKGVQLSPEHLELVAQHFPEVKPPPVMNPQEYTKAYAQLLAEQKFEEAAALNQRYVEQTNAVTRREREIEKRREIAAQAQQARQIQEQQARQLKAQQAAQLEKDVQEARRAMDAIGKAYSGYPKSVALKAIEAAKHAWTHSGDIQASIRAADAMHNVSRQKPAQSQQKAPATTSVTSKGRTPAYSEPSKTSKKRDGFVPDYSHLLK